MLELTLRKLEKNEVRVRFISKSLDFQKPFKLFATVWKSSFELWFQWSDGEENQKRGHEGVDGDKVR